MAAFDVPFCILFMAPLRPDTDHGQTQQEGNALTEETRCGEIDLIVF